MIEIIEYILTSGLSIRQAFTQTNQNGYSDENLIDHSSVTGIALIVALQQGKYDLVRYLLGASFINVWTQDHLRLIGQLIREQGLLHLVDSFLTSPVVINLFNSLSHQERFSFVQEFYNTFNTGSDSEIQKTLSQHGYAPNLLLLLTERDTFRRLTDFGSYNQALAHTSQQDLIDLSATGEHE